MATITTTGQIGALAATQTSSLSDILTNVGDKFYTTLVGVYTDVIYGDFEIDYDTLSNTYLEGSLYGLGGNFAITGSGFYSNSPKVTLLAYNGNDGFSFGVKGLFTVASLKLTEVNASWNGESILFKGSLDENGYGSVTSVSLAGGGLTWNLGGSMTFDADIGGSLKSIALADGSGNSITLGGSFSYAALENVATIGNLVDTQSLYSGNDTFNVPDGSRAWHGYAGNDKLSGGALADQLYGDEGNDKLFGYAGSDTLDGGAGNDQLTGGDGDDQLTAGDGNDKIVDSAGNNTVSDLAGNANITLGSGSDSVTTGAGNDKISAGDGNNEISAGAGNDKIVTGSGNDVINGGAGKDTVTDTGGNDLFVFDNLAVGGFDTITGFQNLADALVFDGTVFTSLAGGIASSNLVVAAKAVALDADDYLLFSTSGGKLYYDADGSGGGAAVQIAALKGVTLLDANSLMLES